MLFAPFWMALNGLWLVLAGYLVLVAGLSLLLAATGVASHWIALTMLALHVVIGFEAASLKRWTLERRGWRFISSVAGRSAEDCERRFFEAWLPKEPFLDGGRLAAPASTLSGAEAPLFSRSTRPWWRFGSKEPV
jgi:hypothetical protein